MGDQRSLLAKALKSSENFSFDPEVDSHVVL